MADPNATVADYYLQQYIMTHQQRYQQMLKMAQFEAQQGYEARIYQQKYLAQQSKQLRTYVGTLEKDLTAYLDDKEGGTTNATRDLTLMRMQIDIAKGRAAQQSSADQRKIAIAKTADAEFDIPRTQVTAIQTSGAEIERRGRLAGTSAAALSIVESELADIVVDNAGSGSAVNAAQQFIASTQQAFDRAGQPGYYTTNEAAIAEKVEAHFNTEVYTPKAVSKPPSNLDLDIADAKKKQKEKDLAKYGQAHTSGLSEALNKLKKMETGKKKLSDEEILETRKKVLAGVHEHEDYLTLVTELNKDGSIDKEDYELFKDKITTEEASLSYPEGTPEILKGYQEVIAKGIAAEADIPRAERLLYDPVFMRKGAAIGAARKELTKLQEKAAKVPVPPSYEQIRQRGRELYSPIRMTGRPPAGQQFTVMGTDGEPVTINIADIDAMQNEFESFLSSNPLIKQDFGLIQEAYGIAQTIKVPGKDTLKTSPQYMGYTLHQQYKAGTIKDAAQAYKIASAVAGPNDKLRDKIITNFHAYNLQPTINQFKGVSMEPTSRRLADEFIKEFGEEGVPLGAEGVPLGAEGVPLGEKVRRQEPEGIQGKNIEEMIAWRSASKENKTWDRFKEREFVDKIESMGLGPLNKAEKKEMKTWIKIGAMTKQSQYELALLKWRHKGKIDEPIPTASQYGIVVQPPKVQVPTLQKVMEPVDPDKPEGEQHEVENIVFIDAPENYLDIWFWDKETKTYDPTRKPLPKPKVKVEEKEATPTLEEGLEVMEKEAEVFESAEAKMKAIPVGHDFWQAYGGAPKQYAYSVTGYDEGGVPQWGFKGKEGVIKPGKMDAGMIQEAQGLYDAYYKALLAEQE